MVVNKTCPALQAKLDNTTNAEIEGRFQFTPEHRPPTNLSQTYRLSFRTRSQTTRKAALVVCPWTVLVVTVLTMIQINNILSVKIYLLDLAGRMTHPRCGLISRGATVIRNRPEAPGLGLLRIRLISPSKACLT